MSMTTLTDTEQTFAELLRAGREPALVGVPELAFLMVDGHGDPNVEPAFADAVQALYGVSYTIKFAIRAATGVNRKVAPLEGLWSVPDMALWSDGAKGEWDWTLMIRQPAE